MKIHTTLLRESEAGAQSGASPTPTDAKSNPSEGAPSSSAEPGDDEKSLGQIVQEVAAKHSAKPDAASSAVKEEPTPAKEALKEEPAPEEDVEKGEEPEVEPKQNFDKHPRFKELIAENKQLKESAAAATAVKEFCQQNHLSMDDLQGALRMAAMLKTDPKAFRGEIQKIIDTMDFAEGSRLPADLQKAVDDGTMPEEYAKELSRLRGKTQGQGAQLQQQQEQQRIAAQTSITNALNTWEDTKKTTDPEYDVRRPLIEGQFALLVQQHGPLSTVAEAVSLVEKAYAIVVQHSSAFTPKPKAKKQLATVGSSARTEEPLAMNDWSDLKNIVNTVAAKHKKAAA